MTTLRKWGGGSPVARDWGQGLLTPCSASQLKKQNRIYTPRTLGGRGQSGGGGGGVMIIITGAAVVDFPVSLGMASWGVTQDICIPHNVGRRLTAGISSTRSSRSQSSGHWYAGHLVVDLTLASPGQRSSLGPRAVNRTNTDET